jgi:hypothetical protein
MIVTVFLPVALIVLIGGAFSVGAQKAGSNSGCAVSDRFPQEVLQWCSLITAESQENDVHPDLLASLIWLESGGNPEAYSHSGAVGLMQIMPRDGLAESFECPKGPCFKDRPTMGDLKDPDFNVEYGTRLLGSLIKQNNGDLRAALRLYGPMDVGYRYADTILSIFEQYGNP